MRVRWVAYGMVLVFASGTTWLRAEEQGAAPSAELLEFIALWQTADGREVDVEQFEQFVNADVEDEKHDK